MPNILKLLSPISILIGLAGAAALIAFLLPIEPGLAVTIGTFAFVVVAGVAELVRRMLAKNPPSGAPANKAQDDA